MHVPPSQRRHLPEAPSECRGLVAYPSAQAAYRAILAQHRQRHKPKDARVYRCAQCHQYHHGRA
jgi:hypothetical protein